MSTNLKYQQAINPNKIKILPFSSPSVNGTYTVVMISDLSKFLTGMFFGKIINVYSKITKKRALLSREEAQGYITTFIPLYLTKITIFDGAGNVNSAINPVTLLKWYAAEDELSKMEIRYPRTKTEQQRQILLIKVSLGYMSGFTTTTQIPANVLTPTFYNTVSLTTNTAAQSIQTTTTGSRILNQSGGVSSAAPNQPF